MSDTQHVVHHESESSGSSFLILAIFLVAIFFLFFYFGLPLIQRQGQSGPQIQVPDKVDVNINSK